MPFLSEAVHRKYGRTNIRYLGDCIRNQVAVERFSTWCRTEGNPGPGAAYRHYLRTALVRELTREIDENMLALAREWAEECRILPAGAPAWQVPIVVERCYDGGWDGFLADWSQWNAYERVVNKLQ